MGTIFTYDFILWYMGVMVTFIALLNLFMKVILFIYPLPESKSQKSASDNQK